MTRVTTPPVRKQPRMTTPDDRPTVRPIPQGAAHQRGGDAAEDWETWDSPDAASPDAASADDDVYVVDTRNRGRATGLAGRPTKAGARRGDSAGGPPVG